MTQRVAILCAGRRSTYHELPDLDVYDETRDARTFPGGMPVVAHPPCRSWSAYMRHWAKPAAGEQELGLWCVEQVRANGGVLEQPAHSRLWRAAKLPEPGTRGLKRFWSLAVQQAWWGYLTRKATWLLIVGVTADELPDIPFCLRETWGDRQRYENMSHRQRSETPRAFAEWLVETARRTRYPTRGEDSD